MSHFSPLCQLYLPMSQNKPVQLVPCFVGVWVYYIFDFSRFSVPCASISTTSISFFKLKISFTNIMNAQISIYYYHYYYYFFFHIRIPNSFCIYQQISQLVFLIFWITKFDRTQFYRSGLHALKYFLQINHHIGRDFSILILQSSPTGSPKDFLYPSQKQDGSERGNYSFCFQDE